MTARASLIGRLTMLIVAATIAAAVAAGVSASPREPQAAGATNASQPLSIVMSARGVQPGEVVRLDIAAGAASHVPGTLSARAFDSDVPVISLGQGRWRALVGIDLDVTPGEHIVRFAWDEAGRRREQDYVLAVAEKEFRVRRLRVDPRFVEPPASVRPRIERERKRLAALFGSSAAAPLWRGPFTLPVETKVISNFGARSIFNGVLRQPHSGADLAGKTGTPIVAPNGGRVLLAESLYFTGNTVLIDHGAGLFSLLAHLSKIGVKEGERVARGEHVGAVGATGRVTGPHLHWSVRLGAARVDPISLIDALEGVADAGGAVANGR